MAYGTDERAKCEWSNPMNEEEPKPKKPPAHKDGAHITEVLATRAEHKIDHLNEATKRLSELSPAANLTEAIEQLLR